MAFRREKKRIGDMLINENVITQEQLEKALPIAKEKHKKIGETLIELGFTNELEIAKALSQQLGLELVNVSAINIPEEVQNLVSETVLRKHVMIPYAFDKNNANIVHVAMADPMDMVALDDFSIVTNLQVEPAVATGRDILLTLDKYYGDTEAMKAAQEYARERKEREQKNAEAEEATSKDVNNYPFKIADEINIATTHKQYYQLDMNQDADGDGESDIVVWYTLSNQGIYEQSPKDVRNNYYIYTMGNVTYSGVGHSDFSNNEDELKLYINTMIAAYSAAVHEPSIYLKENADTDSNDISTLYATIDDAIEEEAANKADARLDGADSTQDVYFTVKDSNLVRNQIDDKTVVYMDFYIEDPQKNPKDETIGTGDDKIYLKKVDWDIYSLNNDGTENELINNSKENSELKKDPRNFFENNKTYKVKVPLSVLPEEANSIKIYAVGYSKIYQSLASGGDKETTTAKAYKTFQIQRVGLADLD